MTRSDSISDLHVIFGTGPLGMSVMRALVQRGKPVRMINRSGRADVPAGVEVRAADAYTPSSALAASAGAAVIYQCAQPEYHEWVEKFPPLQASILEAAIAHGAKFIVGDNLYMYSPDAHPISEDSPQTPVTKKGRVRKAMADAVLAAHRAGRVRVALGRGSDFFGPQVKGSSLGERFFENIVRGKPGELLGNIHVPHTFTFIDDFGTALVNLGERDEALGRAWHVPNAPAETSASIVSCVEEMLGKPVKVRVAGKWYIRFGGLFVPAAREMIEMFYEFEKPYVVDDSQYKRVFGDHSTPLREGLRQTLEWYQAHVQNGHHAA